MLVLVAVLFIATHCVGHVLAIEDGVAIKDVGCLPAADVHNDLFGHAGVAQVSSSGSAQVMEEDTAKEEVESAEDKKETKPN